MREPIRIVMPGLVPGIHAEKRRQGLKKLEAPFMYPHENSLDRPGVDGRDKPGHDGAREARKG
ncbi:MAG: hypothetical protein HYS06_09105 [Methylocystis sp.]|nr:hypothetical protein [Methylocystis sp.]